MARIFITGSSDGLGLLSAKQLIASGHRVVVHARNEERAKSTVRQISGAEDVVIGDLSGMEETKQLAEKVNKLGTFNAIIHNAGIYRVQANARSIDGLPLLFAVNSLAPFILTTLINRPERLIYLSSGMHRQGNASEDRLNSILDGKYFPSYSDTKLHNLILALAVNRKWPGVISNAVDPGWVPTKMGGSHAPDDLNQGFETQVWLAVEYDKEALRSGRLLYHKKEVNFNLQAKEENIQEKFLSACEKITGLPFISDDYQRNQQLS